MNKTIKKIIAREGLIVVSIILLGIITSIMPNSITIKDTKIPIDLTKESRLKIRNKKTGMIYTIIVPKEMLDKKVSGYDVTGSEAMQELGRRGDVGFLKNHVVIKKELSLVNIKNKFYFLLFLMYPFYLLIRFIIWAIRTLKEK